MQALRVAALLAGVAVLLFNAADVVRILIVPRAAAPRLARHPMALVRWSFRRVAVRSRSFERLDRILALSEPVALVVLLATWLIVTTLGFSLVDWGVGGQTWSRAFTEAGSSVFTLGFATGHDSGSRIADFAAAGTGMVLVALQIAYLPTLYGAYNRRETLVTLLESRAGAPAWGPELLIRHQLVGVIDGLAGLFAEWERWSADVAESHTTYASLLQLRSPRPQNSWILSLLAVLDAASLSLAVDPTSTPVEARMCIRMGFTCLRDIAAVLRIPFEPDPSPDQPIALPRAEFDSAYDRLMAVGYPVTRPADDAWPHFRGWRVNYESVAYEVARRVHAPPAAWSGPRDAGRSESMEPTRPVDRQPTTPSDRSEAPVDRTASPSGTPSGTGSTGGA